MNVRTTIAALAFCLASSVTFAATPASTAANPSSTPAPMGAQSTAAKPASVTHCARGHVLQNGKCVAKSKNKPKS
ncbi:MAG TPA: hypothetical protein PKC03_01140 [Dokdonella sp.]|jgi:hypothetical protein|nr:hypothetical protein [Dokdonella sp.]